MVTFKMNELEKVEILTLEDNYINLTLGDNSNIVRRASPYKDMQFCNSILAEHGFSALIKATTQEKTNTMIFDFGFSTDVAARNSELLNADLTEIEAAALSHGHLDHFGGLVEIANKIGKSNLEFVVHPAAFRSTRYMLIGSDRRIKMPSPSRETVEAAGFRIVETREPYPLFNGDILFLGEIPRKTSFERGIPNSYCKNR